MRKSKLIIISIVLVMAAAFAFTGCGGGEAGSTEGKIITDCAGRQVEIPENPERVACLYATAAHMMAMLDEGDKIVGCPNGVKFDVLMQIKYPEITETATPHQEGAVNVEELLRIDSDLALVSASLAANEGEMAKLEDMGIPCVVIDYTTIDELRSAVKVAGEVFDKEEKALSYIEFFDDTLAMVDERLKDVDMEDAPGVYHSVNEAIRTDPRDSICAEIMQRAKVEDISAAMGTASTDKNAYVTLEEIYKWDPDAFIANEYSVTDYILEDSKWSGLTAVKEKKVYTLPIGATRWCHPGSMEAHMGVLAVALQFYPEKFEDFDMKEYTADYYSEYFGLELDDEMIDNILAGEGMRSSNSPVN
ncbi:MAG: ABC transporter substrate-binding protein [Lentihominibacter sp.]